MAGGVWNSALLVGASAAFLSGCGSETQDGCMGTACAAAGSSGAGAPATGGTAPASGGSSSAGSGVGGSSTGGASTAGSGSGACTGTFGEPRTVLPTQAASYAVGSLSLSPDELELLWAGGLTGMDTYLRSTRVSKADAFGLGTPISGLESACSDPTFARSGDLSSDGLRLYFSCYDYVTEGASPVGDLRIARRSSLGGAWTIDAAALGSVSASPTISSDELAAFATPEGDAPDSPTPMYTRSSLTDSFGTAMPSGVVHMSTPDLSADGLHLYGAVEGSLMVASRSSTSEMFSGPVLIRAGITPSMGEYYGSAAISNDCRSLYFVVVTYVDAQYLQRADVMTR